MIHKWLWCIFNGDIRKDTLEWYLKAPPVLCALWLSISSPFLSSIITRFHPSCTAQARSSAAALRLVPYRAISIYFSPGAAASSNPAALGWKMPIVYVSTGTGSHEPCVAFVSDKPMFYKASGSHSVWAACVNDTQAWNRACLYLLYFARVES